MEKRSLVLTALILAFLAAGAVFYGLGRQAGILPGRLAAQPVQPSPTPETIEGPVAVISPDAEAPTDLLTAEATPTTAPAALQMTPSPSPRPLLTVSPSPMPALSQQVAAARGVAPTAASGGGGMLLLTGGLAMAIGTGSIVAAARR